MIQNLIQNNKIQLRHVEERVIIQNKIILIIWPPGSWKTFITSYFAWYKYFTWGTIFSNVIFTYYWKKVNKTIQRMEDIKYIEYQETKWLIVIDESWLNLNSRRSMSDKNLKFAELTFLSRKKNCDLIYIWQLDYSIDRYIRDLANATLFMKSNFWDNFINFEIKIMKQDYLIGYKNINLIEFARDSHIQYNTLESSKISWGDKKEDRIKEKLEKIKEKKRLLEQKKENIT